MDIFFCIDYPARQQNHLNLKFGLFFFPIPQDRSGHLPLFITVFKIRTNTREAVRVIAISGGPGKTRRRLILRFSFLWQQREISCHFLLKQIIYIQNFICLILHFAKVILVFYESVKQ